MATPYVTILRDVVRSTQDLAATELVSRGEPVLVVAHVQTAGRGRVGNPWWQADRAVAASLALPQDVIVADPTVPLSVGLAVRQAIGDRLERSVTLKWPNDIVLDGAKVGGILVELKEDSLIVGCGLNLYWQEPPAGAGGLLAADPGSELGPDLARAWADELLADGFGWDRDAYAGACATLGTEIVWDPKGSGIAVGIADDGGLIVDTTDGTVVLRSGEVRSIRAVNDDGVSEDGVSGDA